MSQAINSERSHTAVDLTPRSSVQNQKNSTRVAVIGTGWFGTSFCARLIRNAIPTRLGTRNPHKCNGFLQDFANVLVDIEEALAYGNIIILAIPENAHEAFVQKYAKHLDGRIIVDVSNSYNKRRAGQLSCGERLVQILDSHCSEPARVVKAFNNVSAYELDNDGHIQRLLICGNHNRDVVEVMYLAREMQFAQVLDVGDIREASKLEAIPHAYFEKWTSSLWLSAAIFTFFIFWATFRYNVYSVDKYPWKHWILQITDKAFSALSLILLALTYLPGCIAQSFNLVGIVTTGSRARIPKWLVNWLNARKQIGLLALYFGIVHTFEALMILNASYYPKYYEKDSPEYPVPKFNTEGEITMFLGLVGLLFMAKQSVTSIPSVQALMSWKEFNFVQVYFGWVALAASALHVIVIAWPSWTDPTTWPGGMPGITIMSTLIPMITLGWKIILIPTNYIVETFVMNYN